MNQNSPPPPGDFEEELAALLSAHHRGETIDPREHLKTCEHCQAIAFLIGNLRRDMWTLFETRRAA